MFKTGLLLNKNKVRSLTVGAEPIAYYKRPELTSVGLRRVSSIQSRTVWFKSERLTISQCVPAASVDRNVTSCFGHLRASQRFLAPIAIGSLSAEVRSVGQRMDSAPETLEGQKLLVAISGAEIQPVGFSRRDSLCASIEVNKPRFVTILGAKVDFRKSQPTKKLRVFQFLTCSAGLPHQRRVSQ
jgi:hypothetical protein